MKDKTKILRKIRNSRLIFLIISVILFLLGEFFSDNKVKEGSVAAKKIERALHVKEHKLKQEMSLMASISERVPFEEIFSESVDRHKKLFDEYGIIILIYESDSLKYWSDHTAAVENYLEEVCLDDRLVQLKNGWFEVQSTVSRPAEKRRIYGLIILKKEYPYENEYLVNEFPGQGRIFREAEISKNIGLGHLVSSMDGKKLFGLVFNNKKEDFSDYNALSLIIFLIGIGFLLLFLKRECDYVSAKTSKIWGIFLMLVSFVMLRYLCIKISFPESFYTTPLFNPLLYGDATSFWLPSLGDLLVNSIVGLFFAYYVYASGLSIYVKSRMQSIFVSLALLILLSLLGRQINTLFSGMIQNSNISLNVNNLFGLSVYSYISLLIVGILLSVFFMLGDKAVMLIRSFRLPRKQLILVYCIAGGAYTIFSHLLGSLDLIMVLWPLVLVLAIYLSGKGPGKKYSFAAIIFLVFIFSLYSVHILVKFSGMKELDSRRVFAEKLAAEQDPLAEHLFKEVAEKISADTMLYRSNSSNTFEFTGFEKKLLQKYMGGYWSKYETRAYGFDTSCVPFSKSMAAEKNDHAWFESLVKERGNKTENKYMSFLSNPSGRLSYMANVPLYYNKNKKLGNVFIEFNLRFVSEEIGFPELLLDREIGLNQELANYSYAKYKNDTLISYHGKYQYGLSNKIFKGSLEPYSDKVFEGYDHLMYRADANTLVVISRKSEGLLERITTFSYLFTFFSLMLLVLLSIRQFSDGGIRLSPFSFKNRIQYLLVMIVLVSLTLFGAGTIFYIQQQFQTKNKENVNEKMFSALAELQHELGDESVFRPGYKEYLTYVLKRISSIVFTDINLYDTKGNVIASSLPKIFDEGLISGKMSPEAYRQLAVNQKLQYTHDEKIGNLEYVSAYAPVKTSNGKILAYLNLPYFSKQNELEKEISTFLIALINIYVLLFMLSVVIAVLISNYVTNPLKLIQDKLSNIQLGKKNEPIKWQNEDEIGSLVKEYNRMIVELSSSAELLAKSERESAWREMAKQVAHEIKNPLTPMKLSVQHLQRIWKDNSPDMGRKIERLTQTLIEQIDTLSHIASEFSTFAIMPKAVHEKVDLVAAIHNSMELFKESEEVEISYQSEIGRAMVSADKDQLLRVFNNLIKNAIQAIPSERKGRIEISLEKQDTSYLVKIRDNGSGIREEQMNRIFVPYFTTKTGGMGLGLAMVKNIVESMEGKIGFETTKDKGTTFFISLFEFKD